MKDKNVIESLIHKLDNNFKVEDKKSAADNMQALTGNKRGALVHFEPYFSCVRVSF